MKPKHLEQNSPMFSFPFGFPPTFTIGFSPSFPSFGRHLPVCEDCGWQAMCGTDMVEHMRNIHGDYRDPFEVYKNT